LLPFRKNYCLLSQKNSPKPRSAVFVGVHVTNNAAEKLFLYKSSLQDTLLFFEVKEHQKRAGYKQMDTQVKSV